MIKKDFLELLQDAMQRDDEITENMLLDDIEEWDSLSSVATTSIFKKKFEMKITNSDLDECETISDIIRIAGDNIE